MRKNRLSGVLLEHRGEGTGANRTVLLHLHELLRGQLSRFQQNGVGNAYLPDVVESGRLVQSVDERERESRHVQSHFSHLLSQHFAEGANALDVPARIVGASLGQLRESEDGCHLGGRYRLALRRNPLREMRVVRR